MHHSDSCQHQSHNNQSNFLSGFIMGALFGGVVALLFMSKNGRRALEEILDKGLSLFDNVDSLFSDMEEDALTESVSGQAPLTQSQPASTPAPTLAQAYEQQPAIMPVQEPIHKDVSQPLTAPEQELYFRNQSQFAQPPVSPVAPMIAGISEPESRTRRFFHGIPKRRSN